MSKKSSQGKKKKGKGSGKSKTSKGSGSSSSSQKSGSKASKDPKDPKDPKMGSSANLTFLLFFLITLGVAVLIVKPFFSIIVISAILAYVFHPAYEGFLQLVKSRGLAAFIVIMLLFLLILFPMVLAVGTLTRESIDTYQYIKEYVSDAEGGYCDEPSRLGCATYLYLTGVAEKHNLDVGQHLREGVTGLATGLVSKVSRFVLNLPVIFLQFFFVLFITYYFLKEGKNWLKKAKKAMPLEDDVRESIVKQFSDVMHATIYGQVLLSIIQGVVGALGYWILGAPSPLLFGGLTIIATFIPYVGGALVWVPLSGYMLYDAVIASNNVLIFKALGVLLFGLFVISTIDNLLKPKIIGDKAKMHPLLVLLGVFGGMAVFGVIGILIGPFMLALFFTSLRIFERERHRINV